jgi:hypothetical protein
MQISLRINGNEIFSFEDKLLNFQLEDQEISLIKDESCLNNFIRTIKNKYNYTLSLILK